MTHRVSPNASSFVWLPPAHLVAEHMQTKVEEVLAVKDCR